MTAWLGMLAPPRPPRSELKGRVLPPAFAPRRPLVGPLAAYAVLGPALLGRAWWAYQRIGPLTPDPGGRVARVEALQDTVATFIHGPATRLIQIPVSTGGRVGAVTIFDDSARHRWLVRCDGLALNAQDQAYQLWFITDKGMVTAALMPMDEDQPMV